MKQNRGRGLLWIKTDKNDWFMLCLLFKTLGALNGVDRPRIERMMSNRWMERRWASALEVALRPHRMCTNSSVEETELELALRTTGKTHVSAREYQYCITVVRPRGRLCDQKRQFCKLSSAKIRDYCSSFFVTLRKGVGIEVVTLEVIWQFDNRKREAVSVGQRIWLMVRTGLALGTSSWPT